MYKSTGVSIQYIIQRFRLKYMKLPAQGTDCRRLTEDSLLPLTFTQMIHNCMYTPRGGRVARKQCLLMLVCVRECGGRKGRGARSSQAAKGSGGNECKAEK